MGCAAHDFATSQLFGPNIDDDNTTPWPPRQVCPKITKEVTHQGLDLPSFLKTADLVNVERKTTSSSTL